MILELFDIGDFFRSIDSVGELTFRDRKSNVIITGSENVYPAEIERVLRTIDGVAEAAVVLDAVAGKKIGDGLDAIPSRQEAVDVLKSLTLTPFPAERREREKLIFRTYDIENVNVQRKV